MIRSVLFVSFATLFVSIPSHAGIFDEADRLFGFREGGLSDIARARTEYLRHIDNVSQDELAHAVQQVGKLAVFEGHYILGDNGNRSRLAALFKECRDVSGRLDEQGPHITILSYWRMACTAQYMKYASLADRLRLLPVVKEDFNKLVGEDLEIRPEINIDFRYMGGGMGRVLGALYVNSLSNLLRDDLPNPEKALEMINRTFNAAPYPGTPHWGFDHYRNYRYKVEILRALDQDDDASEVLEEAIAEIEELIEYDELPVGLEPETRGELTLLKSMRD